MTAIYKGDDTGAFGQDFIIITISGMDDVPISKCIFQCGPVQKVFTRPQFPIRVNFSHEESKRLPKDSVCYLQVFDESGRRQTCEGTLSFTAQAQVVQDESRRANIHSNS